MRSNCFLMTLGLFVATMSSTCSATDQYFSDIANKSANGRYQFTATSPDNANGQREPFQSNFTYRLTDEEQKTELWKHGPLERTFPRTAYVSNDGIVVVHGVGDQLTIFAKSGTESGTTSLLGDCMTESEVKNFVRETTVGSMWHWQSRWYFFSHESAQLFFVRPYWGRRLLVDLTSAKPISETPELSSLLDDEEARYVETVLKRTLTDCENAKNQRERDDFVWRIHDAIQITGQRKLKSHAAVLHKLESIPCTSACVFRVVDKAEVGEITPDCFSSNRSRRLIQLALRRLGERPKGFAVTVFTPEQDTVKEKQKEEEVIEAEYNKSPLDPVARVARVAKIKNGMSPSEVIKLIGPPDYVRDHWEYDLDGETPSSLLIALKEWNNRYRVQEYWQTKPAHWELGLRDGNF